MKSYYLAPERIRLCDSLKAPQEGVIICDEKLLALYPELFDKSLAIYPLKASEKTKSWETLAGIYEFLADNKLRRSEIIQVLGGGITCDIAAFAAATFKRGCRIKLYPSTLLAMVDAALGGKSALNHLGQRNLIGSFYPAEAVIIYPDFLKSLPEMELRQGKAEMLKSYLLCNELSEVNLQAGIIPNTEQIMEYALYKMRLCAEDPYDKGIRRLLNFGHSYGHVYGTLLDYRYKHGDAVVMGIYSEVEQSYRKGYLPEADYLKIIEELDKYPLPEGIMRDVRDLDKEMVTRCLAQDKKQGGMAPIATGFRKVEVL